MRPLKYVENYQYILNNISQPRLFLFGSKYGSIYPLKKKIIKYTSMILLETRLIIYLFSTFSKYLHIPIAFPRHKTATTVPLPCGYQRVNK